MKGLHDGKTVFWLAAVMALAAVVLLFGEKMPQGTASQEEKRIAEVLGAMAGAGRVEVALFYAGQTEAASPTGAVIVAQGADEMEVRLNLIRAARTLLGLPENAVDVFAMEEEKR